MLIRLRYLSAAIAICAALAFADSSDTPSLSSIVANSGALHRVTAVPHPMADSTLLFCRAPAPPNANIHEGHGLASPAYCHVYVTKDATKPMESGKGEYPRGSVIIKAKLKEKTSDDAVLYTIMQKMEEGYDGKHGDWEYSVLDGASHRVLARGKIDSCIECHEQYASTDYVTRAYMK